MKEYTLSREKIQATEASLERLLFLTASFFEDMEWELEEQFEEKPFPFSLRSDAEGF